MTSKNGTDALNILMKEKTKYENKDGLFIYEQQMNFQGVSQAIDVESETLKQGWVTKILGKDVGGIYVYHKPIAKLIGTFQKIVKQIAEEHDFAEQVYPRHYSIAAGKSFGWIDNDFIGKDTGNKLTKELMLVSPLIDSEDRTNHELIIDTVQCQGFYNALTSLQKSFGGKLPDELLGSKGLRHLEYLGGWTFRNELQERLHGGWATAAEFSGVEIVYAGLQEQVYRTRWEMFTAITQLLDTLGMRYRIVIGGSCSRDACHPEELGITKELYEIPTLDIEVFVPQYEKIGKSPWIEIGGGDIAGTRLIDNFDLKLESGKKLYSGCQGVGWQRITFGFLSQYGLNPKIWPQYFLDIYSQGEAKIQHDAISLLKSSQ